MEGPDGSQATDANGNPVYITAQLTDEALESMVNGDSMEAALSTEFVGASGDTTTFRGAFRRGQFVVYVAGQESKTNFSRTLATADAVLRAAS